ncbi:MAG TPA: Uma2 family endonuclease [Ktedonosporobacter sp.]|nr:Uma2 family endonuclease [Ktedonosporobacter sp.]
MTAFPRHHIMSVEDYFQLDRNSPDARYEYIEGHIRMLAGGSPDHAKISANMIGTLYGLLEGKPCSVYTSDVRVCLSESRYVYPDVSVSCDSEDQERGDMLFSPCLIVEVLSPSTERYDRGRKMLYYRECPTVREYVMIDSLRPCIELFRWERVNLWTHYVFRPGDEVELSSLSLRFPLTQIYRNVAFPEQDDIFE